MNLANKKTISIFVVISIVFWFFYPLLANENRSFSWNNLNNKKNENKNLSNYIFLKEPKSDDYNIDIINASLGYSGFVAILDNDLRIIGVSRFLPMGLSIEFPITLIKPLKKGHQYEIRFYKDNGNNRFRQKEDTVYINPENNLASVSSFLVRE